MLRKLLKALRKSNKQVMLIQIVDDDQLYSEIKKLGKGELLKSLPAATLLSIDIKSKLLCDQNTEVSSCSLCDCVLTNHFYTLDRQRITPTYTSIEKESLVSVFAACVKNMAEIHNKQSLYMQFRDQAESKKTT